jgi:hypothetical protein
VLAGVTKDKQGRELARRREGIKVALIVTGALVLLEVILLIVVSASAASSPSTFDEGAAATHKTAVAAPAAPVASAAPAAPAKTMAPKAAPSKAAAPKAAAPATNTLADWANSTYGTFAPVTKSGAGDDVITLPTGGTAGIVTAKYSGTGTFSISILDASNQSTGQLLVNTIGAYNGVTSYGFSSLGDGVTMQVSADASWSITISPVASAPYLKGAGSGDGVFLYSGKGGILAATNSGEGNFVVQEQTGADFSDPLLINEIGAYSGKVPLMAGPAVITIESDGGWTVAA